MSQIHDVIIKTCASFSTLSSIKSSHLKRTSESSRVPPHADDGVLPRTMRLHSSAVKETLGEILSISLVRNHRRRGDSREQRVGASAKEGGWRQRRNREEESKDWRIWRWKPELTLEEDRPPPTEEKFPKNPTRRCRSSRQEPSVVTSQLQRSGAVSNDKLTINWLKREIQPLHFFMLQKSNLFDCQLTLARRQLLACKRCLATAPASDVGYWLWPRLREAHVTRTFFYQLIQSGSKFNGDASSSFCGIIQRASLQFILWNQERRLVLRCGWPSTQ